MKTDIQSDIQKKVKERVADFKELDFDKQKEWIIGFYKVMIQKVQKNEKTSNSDKNKPEPYEKEFFVNNFEGIIDDVEGYEEDAFGKDELIRLYKKIITSEQGNIQKKKVINLKKMEENQKRIIEMKSKLKEDKSECDNDLMQELLDLD